MLTATALATFLTGVTEPIEYMFMFVATPLYIIYAFVQGAAFAMADIVHLRVHSFGSIEFLTRTPLAINAGLAMDIVNFIWVTVLFGVIMFFIANFMIKKFDYATPGRNGNYEQGDDAPAGDGAAASAGTSSASSQVINIINLLGGRANIVDVDACMTRLRVTVKDAEKVGTEAQWKAEGAMGLVMKGQGVQAIYGPKADVLKSDIQDVLDSGEVIPETLPSQMTAVQKAEANFKGVTDEVHSVADGQVINIEDVKDPVFSQKMMGDGFAVEPENGKIVSPVAGKVTSIFPTKHALGLVTDNGLEVLVHIGLDTVSLEGKPFDVKVTEGQTVAAGDLLVEANLDAIREAGRATSTVVVFTNADAIKSVKVEHTGKLAANAPVAKVEL